MKKLLEWLSGGLMTDVKGVLDEVITSKEERLVLLVKLQELFNRRALHTDELRKEIIMSETQGEWLQRNWRPIIFLTLGLSILFNTVIYPTVRAFNPELPELEPVQESLWNLLLFGVGGYILGQGKNVLPMIQEVLKKRKG